MTRPSSSSSILAVLYAVAFSIIAYLFSLGSSFYLTPLRERAHHDGYWTFKAGGHMGHVFGIVGASMLVLMLLYTVRKRVPLLRRAGPLGRWLDVHIFLGVCGPLLVILHSSFKVHGLVALSFWSMIIVATSGVLGRYLYLQIPRTRAGEELALVDIERQDRELTEELRVRFSLTDEQLRQLEGMVAVPARTGVLADLVRILIGDLSLRSELRRFARSVRSVPQPVFREFERVVRQKATVRRRIVLWDRLHELFHYWHVLHKPFAVVMYIFMIVHVAVAIVTGYGWSGLS